MSYNLESRTKSKARITKIFIVILQKSPSLNFIQCGRGQPLLESLIAKADAS
jgi:hypothetical protein